VETFRSDVVFVRRVLIVVAIGALAATLWLLSEILLLAFGSILLAVALRSVAAMLSRHTGLSEPWALGIAGIVIAALAAAAVVLFGAQLRGQAEGLVAQLQSVEQTVSPYVELDALKDFLSGSSLGTLFLRAVSWGTTAIAALLGFLLVIAGAIYMAVNPAAYAEGLVMLFPPTWHGLIRTTLEDAGVALRLWLGVQLIAMVTVGLLIAGGAFALGIPTPVALGLINGLLEFVPLVGPILGALPVLLVAVGQSWMLAIWALGLVIVVQQLESNLIMPLLSGRAVALPPAVALFAVVAFGLLFGPLGLILGYPLAVVADAAIRRLYVRRVLGEDVEIAAERERHMSPQP